MRPQLRFASIGLASFFLFLVILFPARAAFSLFAPAEVNGFGITGTIWKGNARIISINNLQLRNTQWDIALTRLLLGRLAANFQTSWSGGFFEGFGSISITNTIRMQDARGAFNASLIRTAMDIPEIGGQVSVQLTELQLDGRWPDHLVGTAEVRDLSSPLLGRGSEGVVGSFSVSFDTTTETDSDKATGNISDTGGPLEVSGTLLLTRPSAYALKVRVAPRPQASASLRKNLEFLGPAESDGAHIFQLAGSL